MSSCRLMFPGVRSSLVFSRFGLKPPASGFQSYFYSSLKTSPSSPMMLYSIIDKTSRLKMKSFSTVRELHNKENSTNCQNTERPPQTQQYKQDEETEEYPAGKGTG